MVNKVGEKTINVSFNLGEEYEADRGDGETGKVVICSVRRSTMLFVCSQDYNLYQIHVRILIYLLTHKTSFQYITTLEGDDTLSTRGAGESTAAVSRKLQFTDTGLIMVRFSVGF